MKTFKEMLNEGNKTVYKEDGYFITKDQNLQDNTPIFYIWPMEGNAVGDASTLASAKEKLSRWKEALKKNPMLKMKLKKDGGANFK